MLGAVIMVIILVVVLPVAFLIGGAVAGRDLRPVALTPPSTQEYEGTELGDLS